MIELQEERHAGPRLALITETKILTTFVGKRAAAYHKILLDGQRPWNCKLT